MTVLSAASLAAALTSASQPDASPLEGMTIGQANYKALADKTFADRVTHYLNDHGVGHPNREITLQTTDPATKAVDVLTKESILGRTPMAWAEMAKAQNLAAVRPTTVSTQTDLATAVARLDTAAGLPPTDAERAQIEANAASLPAELRVPLAKLVDATATVYATQVRLAASELARLPNARDPTDVILTQAERDAMLANSMELIGAQNVFRSDVAGLDVALPGPKVVDPLGLVIVGGTESDAFVPTGEFRDPVLLVDLGGNDVYTNSAAGACPDLTSAFGFHCNGLAVSTVLDLGGDDLYSFNGPETFVQGASGFGGLAVLYDVAGNDHYNATLTRAFGSPSFPTRSAIGYAYVDGGSQGDTDGGVAFNIDLAGNDLYEHNVAGYSNSVIFSYAQGTGGLGGVAVLSNDGGDDQYLSTGLAVPSAFEGVYTDGVAMWGGVGLLVDTGRGQDQYHAWDNGRTTDFYAVGFAAFGGLGMVFEDGGNDNYEAVENPYYQSYSPVLNCAYGTGSFGGVGIFVDVGGNDRYFGDTRHPRGGAAYTLNEGMGIPGEAYGLFVDLSGDDGHFMETHGGAGSRTAGRGVLVLDAGAILTNVFLGSEANLAGNFLDAGGADQYTGAAPSHDGGVWAAGADENLVPTGILG